MSIEELSCKALPFIQANRKMAEWLNNHYLAQEPQGLSKILNLIKDRLHKLDEISELTKFIWQEKLNFSSHILIPKKSNLEKTKEALKLSFELLNKIIVQDLKPEILRQKFTDLCTTSGLTRAELLWPLRVALTGQESSPDVFEIAEILGKDRVLKRISEAQSKL